MPALAVGGYAASTPLVAGREGVRPVSGSRPVRTPSEIYTTERVLTWTSSSQPSTRP